MPETPTSCPAQPDPFAIRARLKNDESIISAYADSPSFDPVHAAEKALAATERKRAYAQLLDDIKREWGALCCPDDFGEHAD